MLWKLECSSCWPTSERITASLSMTAAVRGSSSPTWTPGQLRGDRLELAADLRRGVGLEVERVLVRQAAGEVDHDHRLVRRPPGSRPCRRWPPPGPRPRAAREAQAPHHQPADLEERPPRHAIAISPASRPTPERQHAVESLRNEARRRSGAMDADSHQGVQQQYNIGLWHPANPIASFRSASSGVEGSDRISRGWAIMPSVTEEVR